MKPLLNRELTGTWAALLLPINDDNSINYGLLGDQIDKLIGYGVHGIYSNGTAGEFYNQTEDEFDKINSLLSEKCHAANMPFQIGCSHGNPSLCLSRVKRAVQLRPSAIQIILPDWITCGMDEAIRFMEGVSSACDGIGIVLYNSSLARKVLTPQEIIEIKQKVKSLIGCKVAWSDRVNIKALTDQDPDFSVFVPGHHMATGFTLGARGSYSNVACLNPAAALRWYTQMHESIDDALKVERQIQAFLDTYITPYISEGKYSFTAVDKFLACIGGWCDMNPRVRWPFKSIPESDLLRVRTGYRELGLETVDS